ncbi:hypothetical protein VL05_05770 [Bacillus stratosphericus]|uniref:hypothetical protein n=1 Tax=Bacillus altitudinis TaxID=293387 RepID=UPI00036CE172|nr:hypothetical protein [Bacillus altitudinis]KML03779.1 hypothetical protein VL05_05770 [Bacillus stratosphericus]KML58935.1 hypothetical protein VL17_00675 [Bacillus stratosphericus]MDT1121428.1 hypothetical protein [Bacillus altitudinis]
MIIAADKINGIGSSNETVFFPGEFFDAVNNTKIAISNVEKINKNLLNMVILLCLKDLLLLNPLTSKL